ncbi:hypothetical protein M758_3G261700 [Ceratodon purpureus]|nr:hypothetical protein M758_3G261700 [Ceratodon purpureus]
MGRKEWLPYHFARGVLAEHDGVAVDWAQYAVSMRRCGGHNAASKLMPKYKNPRRPIQWKNPRPTPLPPSPELPTGVRVDARLRTSYGGATYRNPGPLLRLFLPMSSPLPVAPSDRRTQSRGPSNARGRSREEPTDDTQKSPPRLALEGLVRLTDSIRNIAKDRRQQILLECTALREEMAAATETVEGVRSKMEGLHRLHQTWADKITGAHRAHSRALSLRAKARDSASPTTPSAYGMESSPMNSEIENIWDDNVHIAKMNLDFLTERVSKLRESAVAQEVTLGTAEHAFQVICEGHQKKTSALNSELAKMEALIEFLDHPDFFNTT